MNRHDKGAKLAEKSGWWFVADRWKSPEDAWFDKEPDYFHNLNACHDAEQFNLEELTARKHWETLCDLTQKLGLPLIGHWQLGAEWRAEALGITLGLWGWDDLPLLKPLIESPQ